MTAPPAEGGRYNALLPNADEPSTKQVERKVELTKATSEGVHMIASKVLVVDDEPTVRDVMVSRLNSVKNERSLMLSSISHDLRAPLAVLRAAVEAIFRRSGAPGEGAHVPR